MRTTGSGLNFFTNVIDKTPATTGSWVDVDVSGDGVPVGATGVILKIVNTSTTVYRGEVRKNGSTDDFGILAEVNKTRYASVGIDENRIFEAYIESTDVKIYLQGYTDEGTDFFTNAIDKSITTTGAWTDIDASGDIPADATGVICFLYNEDTKTSHHGGIRKKGSTDEITYSYIANNYRQIYQMCGIDANRFFQGKIDNTDIKIYLIGYTKSPVTFFTNAVDKSLDTTGAWTDIDITSEAGSEADGAILFIRSEAPSLLIYLGDVRKNGSSDDHYAHAKISQYECVVATIGLDADQVFEGKIEDLVIDFYLIGGCKFTAPPPVGVFPTRNVRSRGGDARRRLSFRQHLKLKKG